MPSTADKSVDMAEAPPVQSKSSKPAQVSNATDAKGEAAKPAKPERALLAEPAPASQTWTTDLKHVAAAPASLAGSTDLKQAEALPAPKPVSVSADEAQKKTKAAADEVAHKDIDLSLGAPAKSDSGSAKKADTDAILPRARPRTRCRSGPRTSRLTPSRRRPIRRPRPKRSRTGISTCRFGLRPRPILGPRRRRPPMRFCHRARQRRFRPGRRRLTHRASPEAK